MVEHVYSNRELDSKFDNLLNHMREFESDVKEKFDLVIEQTTKTNGRVRWLEKMIYLALGGLGVLSIIVFPLLWALISAGRI